MSIFYSFFLSFYFFNRWYKTKWIVRAFRLRRQLKSSIDTRHFYNDEKIVKIYTIFATSPVNRLYGSGGRKASKKYELHDRARFQRNRKHADYTYMRLQNSRFLHRHELNRAREREKNVGRSQKFKIQLTDRPRLPSASSERIIADLFTRNDRCYTRANEMRANHRTPLISTSSASREKKRTRGERGTGLRVERC